MKTQLFKGQWLSAEHASPARTVTGLNLGHSPLFGLYQQLESAVHDRKKLKIY